MKLIKNLLFMGLIKKRTSKSNKNHELQMVSTAKKGVKTPFKTPIAPAVWLIPIPTITERSRSDPAWNDGIVWMKKLITAASTSTTFHPAKSCAARELAGHSKSCQMALRIGRRGSMDGSKSMFSCRKKSRKTSSPRSKKRTSLTKVWKATFMGRRKVPLVW